MIGFASFLQAEALSLSYLPGIESLHDPWNAATHLKFVLLLTQKNLTEPKL